MKNIVLIFVAIFALTAAASAKTTETIELHMGDQKNAAQGKVTLKFISVLEDSRCPANAKCVWAGNAKIRFSVRMGKRTPKTFDLNSTLSPRSITYDDYEIKLVGLDPYPGMGDSPNPKDRVATVSVTKAAR